MPPDGSLTFDEVAYIIKNRMGLGPKDGIYIIKNNEKLILVTPGLPPAQTAEAGQLLSALAERYDIIADAGVVAAE